MTLLIASITPVIIFLYLIFRKDKNKEPISLLAKCFFGGFLSIIITLIIDVPLTSIANSFHTPFLKSFAESFIVAAIPEEFSKFIILYWIIWKSKFFDEHYDGIVFAVFVYMFSKMEWELHFLGPFSLFQVMDYLQWSWAIFYQKQN